MSISITANLATNARGEASQGGPLAALLTTSPELPLDFSTLLKDQLTRQPNANLATGEKTIAQSKLTEEPPNPLAGVGDALLLTSDQPVSSAGTKLLLKENTLTTTDRPTGKTETDETTTDLSLLAQLTVPYQTPPITTKPGQVTTALNKDSAPLGDKGPLPGDLPSLLQSRTKTVDSALQSAPLPQILTSAAQANISAPDGKAVLPQALDIASKPLLDTSDKPQAAFSDILKSGLVPATKPEPAILAGENAAIAPASPQPSSFSALLANQTNSPAQQSSQMAQLPVNTPLHTPRWNADFGERIVWMARNDQQSAQITINPAQLGPVQITLNLHGDQASAVFASPHAEVRQAIQDAMPQLREMLASSGISLGQANVGAQLQQQNREAAPQFANTNRSSGENAILSPDSLNGSISANLPLQRGRGLVDLFA